MYFKNISTLIDAKIRYRNLAKELHPDVGGSEKDFQRMQNEYKQLLLRLQNQNYVSKNFQQSKENELLNELGKLAQELLRKQIPQNFLKRKIETAKTPLEKGLFSQLVNFLDSFN
jgi:hypothetical protein